MSNIVGIDVGNSKCVVAIAKPKAVQILMNHDAKYEVPSVVSFTKKRRQIGTDKSSLAMMNPQSTISEIKRLIGQNFDEQGMAEELKLLPLKTSKAEDGGIAIHINYLGEEQKFTPVEILAMLLCHLKQMIEHNDDGLPVSNCVISVPSYFNDLQRVAYLDAAKIAGLIPVQLMNDGTAIALGYGIFKRKLESPVIVVFVDVGHSDTQVTVAQFDREGVKILAHASDRNLGGRDFDRVLYNHFLKEFNTMYKIDIESNSRATARLMSACEKAKPVLTVNRDANISIDCLVRDIGVDGSIKRDTFENLSADLLARLSTTLGSALKDARLENAQINAVELVGSGSRIPAISNVVREIFRMEPTRTLNGSDCVARGCALRCLLLDRSRGFNDYKVQDSNPFYVGFSWSLRSIEAFNDDKNQNVKFSKYQTVSSPPRRKDAMLYNNGDANFIFNQSGKIQISSMLFEKGQSFPRTEVTEFYEAFQELQFSSFYEYKGVSMPTTSQKSRTFKVDNINTGSSKANRVRVEISIDLHGMVVINSVSQQTSDKQDIRFAKLACYEMLPIGMSESNIAEAKKRARALLQHDKDVEEGQRQKNDLETLFYSTRKELNGRYEEYVKKIEKERILKKLDELEPLLSENDDNEKESRFYAEELLALQKLVKPVEGRYKYFLDCKEATKELYFTINELDRVCKSKKVEFYNNHYSAWAWTVNQLQNNFPKDVDQLPVLFHKIKRMTTLTMEEYRLTESCEIEDFHQTIERYVGSFKEANKYSLVQYQEGDQMKKERLLLIGDICRRLEDLHLIIAPNSFGADEFTTETVESNDTIESLIHNKRGPTSSEPSRMRDVAPKELIDEPNASSMELKRKQQDRNSERTPEEKDLINSTVSNIRIKLCERYGDYVPQLEYESIDKKLHDIKVCLLNGDEELFDHKNYDLRKFLFHVEEKYMKEENRGQERAQLLYMIFDSRVKMIMLCDVHYMNGMARNPQFVELVELAKIVCDDVENFFEEMKSQDRLDCEKDYKKRIKRLQVEIQLFENTVIEKKLELEECLLDVEKKVFGRYRYVAGPNEKKSISKIIEEMRGSLRESKTDNLEFIWLKKKETIEKVISTLEGLYEENKSHRVEAAAELCDCIFDHLKMSKSKMISSSNASSIQQRCKKDLKWLDSNYQILNITISEIKKRMESLNTYCTILWTNKGK